MRPLQAVHKMVVSGQGWVPFTSPECCPSLSLSLTLFGQFFPRLESTFGHYLNSRVRNCDNIFPPSHHPRHVISQDRVYSFWKNIFSLNVDLYLCFSKQHIVTEASVALLNLPWHKITLWYMVKIFLDWFLGSRHELNMISLVQLAYLKCLTFSYLQKILLQCHCVIKSMHTISFPTRKQISSFDAAVNLKASCQQVLSISSTSCTSRNLPTLRQSLQPAGEVPKPSSFS